MQKVASKSIRMTGSKCLLDTSVIINTFRAHESANPVKHIARLKLFLSNCIALNPDLETADFYGSIKASLMTKGKPIPENDIWIAAIAKQWQLPLYTNDKHFSEVDGVFLFGK